MTGSASRIPAGHHTLAAHLVCRDAARAIEFYQRAFGARELRRNLSPDGKSIMFAELQIGDSRLLLNDEFPEFGAFSPQSLNGSPVTVHMWSEDPDRVFNQALEAGATVLMPLMDQFWGDRYGKLQDPFGHQWAIAAHMVDMTPEELIAAGNKAFGAAESH